MTKSCPTLATLKPHRLLAETTAGRLTHYPALCRRTISNSSAGIGNFGILPVRAISVVATELGPGRDTSNSGDPLYGTISTMTQDLSTSVSSPPLGIWDHPWVIKPPHLACIIFFLKIIFECLFFVNGRMIGSLTPSTLISMQDIKAHMLSPESVVDTSLQFQQRKTIKKYRPI